MVHPHHGRTYWNLNATTTRLPVAPDVPVAPAPATPDAPAAWNGYELRDLRATLQEPVPAPAPRATPAPTPHQWLRQTSGFAEAIAEANAEM